MRFFTFDSDGDVKYSPTQVQPFTGVLPWQPGWGAKAVKPTSDTIFWQHRARRYVLPATRTCPHCPPRCALTAPACTPQTMAQLREAVHAAKMRPGQWWAGYGSLVAAPAPAPRSEAEPGPPLAAAPLFAVGTVRTGTDGLEYAVKEGTPGESRTRNLLIPRAQPAEQ